jgi:hypothetical protein
MNAFALKCLALITMMIDHTGAVLTPMMDATWFRVVGRVAFPIYAFFIAEGCRRTRDIKKYILRLFVFALVSEIPFDLLFANVRAYNGIASAVLTDFSDQNIFFTLALGAVCIWLFEMAQKNDWNWLCLFGLFAVASLGYFCKTDYGAAGVILIFLLYLARRRSLRALVIIVASFYFYVYKFNSLSWTEPAAALSAVTSVFLSFSYSAKLFMAGCLSALPVCLYNERQGARLKWFFYVSYPLHLLLLAGVWFFCLASDFLAIIPTR